MAELVSRVLSRIDTRGLDTCWPWLGNVILPKGYGCLSVRTNGVTRTLYPHRFMWELVHGPIPEGMEIDHLCSNPICCNPEHLEAVTGYENNARSQSISANYARRTHCSNNHEFTPENTRIRIKNGRPSRQCRTCDRDLKRRSRGRTVGSRA